MSSFEHSLHGNMVTYIFCTHTAKLSFLIQATILSAYYVISAESVNLHHHDNVKLKVSAGFTELGRGTVGAHRAMEGGCVFVQDGIKLGMAHVRVLGIQRIPTARELCPGQLAVWAAPWEAVVAYPQDDLVLAHYACANLQQAGGHISGVHLCRSILLSLLIAADYSGLQLICSSAHVHFDIPAQHAASRHSDTALHASMYSPAP